ncbi:hypothetical protein M408DRAFT_331082 [Serendipita vermifera MAFF 305830]|uniref:Uncharacterized protein n=1 Tax=Serendipita vermifera MAFF 305830 TaxID=933852 RepID=A0A0C3B1V3_SERVB|nr:hypothetical protein M408DRAFT_331082 [Serendipita vermifera MAFF 305830]
MATEFLFDSFDSRPARNPRKQHLKTVYDIMHLSILRRDFERAKRSWSILIRCPEFDANHHWKLGLGMILNWDDEEYSDGQQQLDFLKAMMLREKGNKEEILLEIILLLIKTKRHREALDELELKV